MLSRTCHYPSQPTEVEDSACECDTESKKIKMVQVTWLIRVLEVVVRTCEGTKDIQRQRYAKKMCNLELN